MVFLTYNLAEVKTVADCEKMYYLLFNAITDAIEKIKQKDYSSAETTLISSQQEAEDIYIEQ